jgi:hypothetical protein
VFAKCDETRSILWHYFLFLKILITKLF